MLLERQEDSYMRNWCGLVRLKWKTTDEKIKRFFEKL